MAAREKGPRAKKRGREEDESRARKRRAGPLQDRVCAVSVYTEGGDGSSVSYNEVVKQVLDLGARHSANVHKKVHYLVATADAARQRTQRVRKALKLSVPIVSVDFLEACATAGARVEHAAFAIDVPAEQVSLHDPPRDICRRIDVAPRTIDLGCCCSCHDDGALSCSWCEDAH